MSKRLSELAAELEPYLIASVTGTSGSGGSGAGGGVTNHGDLTGLGPPNDDHPQYLNYARGDARYLQAADFEQIEQDVAALKTRTTLADSPLVSDLVQLGTGSPTLSLDLVTLAGTRLIPGAVDLSVDVPGLAGDGIAPGDANDLDVDLAWDFDWSGNHTHTGSVSSSPFDSSDPITGWRLDPDGNSWFSSITATSLSIKTFISDVTLALQGSEYITKSKATIARDFQVPGGSALLYVYDLPGQPDTPVFEAGDWIRLRYVDRTTGLIVGDAWGTVSNYNDQADGQQVWTWAYSSGNVGQTIYEGMVALDYGQSGDGYIVSTSLGADAPYTAVRTWVTDPSIGGNHTTVARLGNLDGIVDAEIGPLSGFGLYSDHVALNGQLIAADGAVQVGNRGINIDVDTDPDFTTLTRRITWREDATNPLSDNIGYVGVSRSGGAGNVRARGIFHVAGGSAGANISSLLLRAGDGEGQPQTYIDITTDFDPYGEVVYMQTNALVVSGRIEPLSHIWPWGDNTLDLGSDAKKWRSLYVTSLHVDQIVGDPSYDHDHDDRYYTEAEIDVLLGQKSDIGHTHPQYALGVDLTAHIDDATVHFLINDAGSGADEVWSAAKVQSEIDAGGAGLDAHINDLTIHYTINDLGATTTQPWSGSKVLLEIGNHAANPAAHHNPVTVGPNLTLADQLVGLGSNVPLLDADNVWSGEQTFQGGVVGPLELGNWLITDDTIESVPFSDNPESRLGVKLDTAGNIFGVNIDAQGGKFVGSTFELNSTVVLGGSEIRPAGGGSAVFEDFRTPLIGQQITIKLANPTMPGVYVASPGDRLRIRTIALQDVDNEVAGSSIFSMIDVSPFGRFHTAPALVDAWFEVQAWGTSTTDYTEYIVVMLTGNENADVPRLAPVANYMRQGAGVIFSTAYGAYAPYTSYLITSDEPWNTNTEVVRIGNLSGVSGANGQFGFLAGTGPGAEAGSYMAATNNGILLHGAQIQSFSFGHQRTAYLEQSGRFRLGIDTEIDSATNFDFNPEAGSLTMRNVEMTNRDGSGEYLHIGTKGIRMDMGSAIRWNSSDAYEFDRFRTIAFFENLEAADPTDETGHARITPYMQIDNAFGTRNSVLLISSGNRGSRDGSVVLEANSRTGISKQVIMSANSFQVFNEAIFRGGMTYTSPPRMLESVDQYGIYVDANGYLRMRL